MNSFKYELWVIHFGETKGLNCMIETPVAYSII